MTALRYLLGSTWKNLTSNRLMNVVSASSISLALMVMGGLLLVQLNSTRLIDNLKSQTSMVIYLTNEVSTSKQQNIESKLISHDAIQDVNFRSQDEAMTLMESRLGEDAIEGLERNPFPASFNVSLKPSELSNIESIAESFSQWSGIDDVDYGEQHVDRLQNVSRIVEILIGSIGIIICVVSIFIIFNTIQLTVMARRDEIDILKLVGATKRFISLPYLLSGAVQGIFGCLIGTGFLWMLFLLVETRIRSLDFFPFQPVFLDATRFGMLLGIGFLIGVIGSATAVSRTVRDM